MRVREFCFYLGCLWYRIIHPIFKHDGYRRPSGQTLIFRCWRNARISPSKLHHARVLFLHSSGTRRLGGLLDVLALGVLLWGVGDGETCNVISISH